MHGMPACPSPRPVSQKERGEYQGNTEKFLDVKFLHVVSTALLEKIFFVYESVFNLFAEIGAASCMHA